MRVPSCPNTYTADCAALQISVQREQDAGRDPSPRRFALCREDLLGDTVLVCAAQELVHHMPGDEKN